MTTNSNENESADGGHLDNLDDSTSVWHFVFYW